MRLISLIAALCLWPCMAMTARAADTAILPEKPQPVAKAKTAAGKDFWIETGIVAASWTADTITTHMSLSANPINEEKGFLFTGSRSTPKIMGAWAAVDVGAVTVAYEWKSRVHNRFLHPLWRLPLIYRVDAHLAGTIQNVGVMQECSSTKSTVRMAGLRF